MYDEVESFLNYLVVERGGPSNTLGAYQNDLRQFIEFAQQKIGNGNGNKGKAKHGWQKIDLDLLTEYVSHLRNNQGYRDSTTARKVAALKSFFSFMVDEGTLKDNPAEFLVSPRVGRTLPKYLTEEETERLLDQPAKRGTVEGQRDLAMLELLYATGLRVSELTSLNLEDINLQEGYIRCLGKGGKERMAYMHPHATEVIRDYMDNARPVLVNGKDEEAVFLNRRGERLTRQWCGQPSRATPKTVASKRTSHPTPCATASPPTCCVAVPACAMFKPCWATPAWRQPKCTHTSPTSMCTRSSRRAIHGPERSYERPESGRIAPDQVKHPEF